MRSTKDAWPWSTRMQEVTVSTRHLNFALIFIKSRLSRLISWCAFHESIATWKANRIRSDSNRSTVATNTMRIRSTRNHDPRSKPKPLGCRVLTVNPNSFNQSDRTSEIYCGKCGEQKLVNPRAALLQRMFSGNNTICEFTVSLSGKFKKIKH